MTHYYRYHGHARVQPKNPEAFAVCDRCYRLFNKSDLRFQYDWRGPRLMNLRILVCQECYDRPQEQLRPIVLPPDPQPIINPRPEFYTTDDGYYGFTLVDVWNGIPGPGGATKAAVLAIIAQQTGLPIPNPLTDDSLFLGAPGAVSQVMASNGARQWMSIFNPANTPFGFSTGTPALTGVPTTIMVGPGQAWFQASAIGKGACYQGAIAAISSLAGAPVWAWEG